MQQLRVGGLKTEIHEASRKVILNTDNLEALVHGRTKLKTYAGTLFFSVSLGRAESA